MKTYDPKKVLISLGAHAVQGLSDGTFVSIEPGADGVTKKVGCDGEVIRSLNPDRSSKVTLTVNQYSPTVAFAQQMYEKDLITGDGTFPIMVKDLKGGLIFSAGVAWIVKSPSREFGKEAADRSIEIDTGEASWAGES